MEVPGPCPDMSCRSTNTSAWKPYLRPQKQHELLQGPLSKILSDSIKGRCERNYTCMLVRTLAVLASFVGLWRSIPQSSDGTASRKWVLNPSWPHQRLNGTNQGNMDSPAWSGREYWQRRICFDTGFRVKNAGRYRLNLAGLFHDWSELRSCPSRSIPTYRPLFSLEISFMVLIDELQSPSPSNSKVLNTLERLNYYFHSHLLQFE